MGKCTKCGTNFVGTAANPPKDGLCRYCERDEDKARIHQLECALRECVVALENIKSFEEEWGHHSLNAWNNVVRICKTTLTKAKSALENNFSAQPDNQTTKRKDS